MPKAWTFYWLDGTREVIYGGSTANEALQVAGYGYGAIKALDFTVAGDDESYEWKNKKWKKKEKENA